MNTADYRRTRRKNRRGVLVALIVALSAAFSLMAMPAMADEVNVDEYDNSIIGNVKLNSEPLEGVLLTVSGGGYEVEVATDAEGRWKVGVPEGDEFSVTLDESTLPDGIAVIDETGEDDTPNVKEAMIGPSGSTVMNFFIGRGERNVTSFFDQFVERIVNGVNFGLMLGLAAIGISLVYGTTGLSNFAHAEMVTFGAVMALIVSVDLGWPIWIAIPLAVLLSAGFGWSLDAGLWKPLRKKGVGVVQLMIVSIGLSLALRYTFQYFRGGGTEQLPGSDSPDIPLFGSVKQHEQFQTTRLLLLHPVLTLTKSYASSGSLPPRWLASRACCGLTSVRASAGIWAHRFCSSSSPRSPSVDWEQHSVR